MAVKKAIFLDKDGTLIPDIPFNADPAKITLSDDSVNGLSLLQEAGYELFVVTNQSGIAHGYFHHKDLWKIEKKLSDLLQVHGISLSGFYYCPHDPKAKLSTYRTNCKCKKPKPGMLLDAAGDHNISLSKSWMIGDILNDVEAGNRAGCKTILINNGNETEWKMNQRRTPDMMASTIDNAAKYILEMSVDKFDEADTYSFND
jgi:D-glycero-D-manno-heptose 1,7-bisphosphate phosphatase